MQQLAQSTRMRKLWASIAAFLCLIALLFSPSTTPITAAQPKNPPCTGLSATFIFTSFQFTSPTTAEGELEIWMDGERVGHATADYFNIQQKGQGVLQMNGHHIHTYLDGSTLETQDEIRLLQENNDPGVVRANSRLYVTGGTGRYAGATGLLHTHGEVNLATLEGGIDFQGDVCVP